MNLISFYLWVTLQVIIGYNLVLPILFFIIYKLKRPYIFKISDSNLSTPDYAIIVTAYEQTHSLNSVVDSLLSLKYENFLIYIVADKCDISSLSFIDDKVVLLRPEVTLGSNIRSHFYAIKNFKRNHSHLTIIDSDNLVEPNYLNHLNEWFNQGFEAVQGVRNAKNLDTTFACLDAARDLYYHFYDARILFGLGSSATLAGSGMAFTTKLYKECLENLHIEGAGFDKVLQSEIVGRNLRIAFSDKAIVYDEKTSKSDQLVNQRARWINTWFKYFNLGFKLILKSYNNRSINQFLFGFVLIRPPLFLFIVGSLICLVINLWISYFALAIWLLAFLFFVIGFMIAITNSKADIRIYKSLINIPQFIFFQVVSLVKSRKANENSVATKHFHNSTIISQKNEN